MTDWSEEPVAKQLHAISRALRDLGTADAATPLGAIEFLGVEIKEGLEAVASSIRELSESFAEIANAIREHSSHGQASGPGAGDQGGTREKWTDNHHQSHKSKLIVAAPAQPLQPVGSGQSYPMLCQHEDSFWVMTSRYSGYGVPGDPAQFLHLLSWLTTKPGIETAALHDLIEDVARIRGWKIHSF
jgi:hypothetical protein